jgi:hypothetical protein
MSSIEFSSCYLRSSWTQACKEAIRDRADLRKGRVKIATSEGGAAISKQKPCWCLQTQRWEDAALPCRKCDAPNAWCQSTSQSRWRAWEKLASSASILQRTYFGCIAPRSKARSFSARSCRVCSSGYSSRTSAHARIWTSSVPSRSTPLAHILHEFGHIARYGIQHSTKRTFDTLALEVGPLSTRDSRSFGNGFARRPAKPGVLSMGCRRVRGRGHAGAATKDSRDPILRHGDWTGFALKIAFRTLGKLLIFSPAWVYASNALTMGMLRHIETDQTVLACFGKPRVSILA